MSHCCADHQRVILQKQNDCMIHAAILVGVTLQKQNDSMIHAAIFVGVTLQTDWDDGHFAETE